MNPVFAVLSGVVALLGLVCLWFWKKLRDEVALIAATPTSRATDVAALAPGTLVEVKGTIRCAAPLTGEFSKQTCVYSRSEIERKETRWKDGKSETYYVNERTTERHAPFHVEDASGRVPVRGEGASVDAVQVYNENANTTAESVVSAVLSLAGQGSYERRYKESVLAPDIPVFVLGTVHEGGVIGAAPPGAKVKEFIITYKSKEQRTRSSGRMEIVMMVIAVVLFAAAAGSLIAAFKYP